MSTRILNMLVTPLLGRFGAAILRAAVAESDRANAAELNEARAKGERDEARMMRGEEADRANSMLAQCEANAVQISDLHREIETLRSEVESGRVADELVAHNRAAVEHLQGENAELRRRCDELSKRCVALTSWKSDMMPILECTDHKIGMLKTERDAAFADATRYRNALDVVTAKLSAADRARHEHVCPPVPSETTSDR